MVRARTAAAAAVLIAVGSLGGCGGEDNPISRDDNGRPGSSASPAASASSPAASPATGAPAASSAAPSGGSTPDPASTGLLVAGDGFTIRMPGQPEKSFRSAGDRITFDIYRFENDTATYTVTRGNYPKIGTLPTLRDAITSTAGQAGGRLATSRELQYRHEPATEGVITGVRLDGKDVTIFARYVVVDRVMYGLLYLDKSGGREIPAEFRTFAESLTF